MPPAAKLLLLFVLAASSTLLTTNSLQLQAAIGAAGGSCIPHERDALLSFKHGISSDPMDLLASWQKDGDCCSWRGVRCSNRTGHILKLQLRNVHISHSLVSLYNLVHLDLSMNYLNGSSSHLPEFLSTLSNLRYLNLSGIPFSGRVPPHLGNLTKLRYLDLSSFQGQHQCQHQMYSTDISWLASLSVLEYLSMSMVNLSTAVDWPDVVNLIPSLKVLSLKYCLLLSVNQSIPRVNLTNLQRLDLSGNIFSHPMASSWLWNLTDLHYLFLADTGLYGQVPDALGNFTSLQVLDLSNHYNRGMMTTSFQKLCNLTVLNLNSFFLYGNMMGLIDLLPRCRLNKLRELHLGYNFITGIMPSQMAYLTSLVVLDVSYNNLTGAIPPGLGQLASLSVLDLSSNKLDGDITEKHFAGLAKLKVLRLSGNSFNITVSSTWTPPFSLQEASLAYCQMGPMFPTWLQFQVNILWVDISSTGIFDKLPDWFSTAFSKATYLDFSQNEIHGRLPKNMERMSVNYFYLSSNKLTGKIPSLLPRNLSHLDLSLNSLSGNLPSKYGTPQLVSLNLFSNHITGGLSGYICELQNLVELDLNNNLFEGALPRCLTIRTLLFVLLRNNSFSGDFPLFLRNCEQLEFLDISRNKFSGKLPQWIGDLTRLRFLLVDQNMFSGNIPTSITNLTNLHHLNLASNRLSGVIPWGISSLKGMTRNYVNLYYFSENPYGGYEELSREIRGYFSAVTKGQELYYKFGIFEMTSIDLSFNQLCGGIPEEITSLDALLNLDLSWNHLSGEVPEKTGVMNLLESLDLSNNMLSGKIPSSLSNLSYLGYLDLSDNNLTGRIPSGRQLDTLYAEHPSMYSGNGGLCGPPLQKMCPGNNASRHDVQNRNEHGFEPMSFYFGLGLGFMLGLWVVFCILLFKKVWRIAYFRLIDSIYYQIYVFVIVTLKRLAREGSTD
ncbi:unnamed protein product [Urochloa decumbens]|uniref:Leucine-rich repeat-containing N-terminal plant-type domain-containing protein n=1 Tax=Urochloa decumbens TaxID=240449 RepID=A0ABC9AUE5_9POAL